MDRILIRDLLVRCVIGVTEEERREKQDVLISLSLSLVLRAAGKSDRLEDSMDYSTLKKRILAHAEESRYFLVEALAESVADICLQEPTVQRVKVRVEKPTGPSLRAQRGRRNRQKERALRCPGSSSAWDPTSIPRPTSRDPSISWRAGCGFALSQPSI